ncbi:MAG: TlpA family protein disulfide reductase [Candidatus Cryptobacteroides sp.]|nr:TlpA disulfide reductase family protein [Bacteroidales bacterium]
MNKIIVCAMAAVAVACTPNSGNTVLKGSFTGPDAPESVHIVLRSQGIDTLIALKNSEFSCELPVDLVNVGSVEAGVSGGNFISDGTVLTVKIAGSNILTESAKPSKSVNSRFAEYNARTDEYISEMRSTMRSLADSTGISDEEKDRLQEEYYDSFIEKFKNFNLEAIAANRNNAVGVSALRQIYYEFEDESLDSLISTLDTAIVKLPFVQRLQEGIAARRNTAEGKMFTDFTVAQPDGAQASLSDYVGKGKYVLVDFWASWCRPCKMEIPYVKAAYNKFKGNDFDVVSVAVWDKPQATVDTAKVYGVNWNQIVDAQSVPTDIYGIMGIPHIILFGPDGTIVKRGLRGEGIAEEVSKYVK